MIRRPVYYIIDLNLSLRCQLGSMTQCRSFSRRTIVPQAKVKAPRTRASPSPSDPSPSSSRPSASTSPCSRTSPPSRTRPRSPSSSLTPSQSNSSTMCPSISRTWKQQKERQATCTRTWRIGKSVFFLSQEFTSIFPGTCLWRTLRDIFPWGFLLQTCQGSRVVAQWLMAKTLASWGWSRPPAFFSHIILPHFHFQSGANPKYNVWSLLFQVRLSPGEPPVQRAWPGYVEKTPSFQEPTDRDGEAR